MVENTMTLYECRNCGGFTSSKLGGCAVCGYNETEEREKTTFDGEVITVDRPWYKSHEVIVKS